MPGRDRTGPLGQGEMTGRGLGPCNGENTGFYGSGLGCGLGRGLGRGIRRGVGMGFASRRGFGRYTAGFTGTKTDQELLAEEKNWLESRLNAITKQLNNLSESNK